MVADQTFRHPYEELQTITALPLEEVVVLGESPESAHLMTLFRASDQALAVQQGPPWGRATRLLIVAPDGVAALAQQGPGEPLPRTCVVLDLEGGFKPSLVPVGGMCVRAEAALGFEGRLTVWLAPEAGTVPEALELLAELFFALGVTLEQRPVDRVPDA